MRNARSKRALAATLGVLVVAVLSGARTLPVCGQKSDAKPEEQVFKNIQIFKGVPIAEVQGAMDFMAASLGVNCDYCHTSSFESDEKPAKVTARAMIRMTLDLNKTGFSGYDVVNCYTCHRGHLEPTSAPGSEETSPGATAAALAPAGSPMKLPALEAVIQAYIEAVGGQSSIEKVDTLIATGSMLTQTGAAPTSENSIEIFEKPGSAKYLVKISSASGITYRGLTGSSGSVMTEGGSAKALDEIELAKVKNGEEFLQYLRLKDSFSRMAVLGRETVGGHDAYMVGAATAAGQRVKLYFDTSNGLLLRKQVARKTILGLLFQTTDFEDYRRVNGLSLPFRITTWEPPTKTVEHFTQIRINAPERSAGFSQQPK